MHRVSRRPYHDALIASLVLLAACGRAPEDSPGDARAPDVDFAAGKRAWSACAKCHCATDPRLPRDTDWVRLNERTACIEEGRPAPSIRAAIASHLADARTLRPLLVGHDRLPAGADTGDLVVPAAAGSAHLVAVRTAGRATGPRWLRVAWDAADDEQVITVPAGVYRVVNYWHYRDADGARWMLSGTNVEGARTILVDAGAEAVLDVEPAVCVRLGATRGADRTRIQLAFDDGAGTRVSVSRDGRLVVPRFRIRAADGRVVDEGPFTPS